METSLKVLWVGRMLGLKRVDTLVRAVAAANAARNDPSERITLTLVGDGPERMRLEALAAQLTAEDAVRFMPPVGLDEVRSLMRSHDVYVFSSNGQDGWGATVSEALAEGMVVLGTCETGASAALLPPENLFSVGDWRTLAKMLSERSFVHVALPYGFTPAGAAERLLAAI